MAIELDDVLKIIAHARESLSGTTTPPAAPAGAPAISGPAPYGHHSTLTPEQASAFQMMMLIQGHNGDTIGRGRVIDHPGRNPATSTTPEGEVNGGQAAQPQQGVDRLDGAPAGPGVDAGVVPHGSPA